MSASSSGSSKKAANQANQSNRRIVFYILAAGFVLFLFGYLGRIADLVQVRAEIDTWQGNISKAEQRKSQLLAELDYVQSDEYVEAEARDQLHLVKPGDETIIVIPDDGNSANNDVDSISAPDQDAQPFNPLSWSWWASLFR
jgi:cell division protein FtsB